MSLHRRHTVAYTRKRHVQIFGALRSMSVYKHNHLHPRWFSRSRGYRWRTGWQSGSTKVAGPASRDRSHKPLVLRRKMQFQKISGDVGIRQNDRNARYHAAWALRCFSSYSRSSSVRCLERILPPAQADGSGLISADPLISARAGNPFADFDRDTPLLAHCSVWR